MRVAAAAADLIIHAGDLTAASMLEQLRGIGEVAAVHGNADDAAVRSLLPTRLELTVGDVRLGIVHDAGAARGRLERLRRSFTEANAVIFGEPLGGLCDGEQSALAEPVAVAGEAVVLAEPDDAQSGEPASDPLGLRTRSQAARRARPGARRASPATRDPRRTCGDGGPCVAEALTPPIVGATGRDRRRHRR